MTTSYQMFVLSPLHHQHDTTVPFVSQWVGQQRSQLAGYSLSHQFERTKNKTYLLFEAVEVVNNDSDEEIQDKKRTHYDEDNVVEVTVKAVLLFWLLIRLLIANNYKKMTNPTPAKAPRHCRIKSSSYGHLQEASALREILKSRIVTLSCIHFEPELHQTMSDCPAGTSCSKHDYR